MDGLLVVDKPSGPTSHDVVARVRRALRERRVGHTGTLDPAATGVLPLVVGRATRLAQFLSGSDKSYEAVIRFGFSTDTGDAQGRALGVQRAIECLSRGAIDAALDAFRGEFLQQPPAFSAKKIDGKRSHRLARARARGDARLKLSRSSTISHDRLDPPDPPSLGPMTASFGAPGPPSLGPMTASFGAAGPPDLPDLPDPVSVTTYAVEVIGVDGDSVTLRVDCSAGFYIRSLAHDLGERLGVGGHLVALRRTRSGTLTLADALGLDTVEREPELAAGRVIPLANMLPGLAPVVLTSDGVRKALHGRELGAADCVSGFATRDAELARRSESRTTTPESRFYRLLDPSGQLVAIARPAAAFGLLHPSVVLV